MKILCQRLFRPFAWVADKVNALFSNPKLEKIGNTTESIVMHLTPQHVGDSTFYTPPIARKRTIMTPSSVPVEQKLPANVLAELQKKLASATT